MEGEIDYIVFTRFTDESIEQISEIKIDRIISTYTLNNTIYDPKLGVNDREKRCETCCENWFDCIGGYGYIKLPYPYIQQMLYKTIIKTLKNICNEHYVSTCNCKKINLIETKEDDSVYFYCLNNKKIFTSTEIYNILMNLKIYNLITYNLMVTPICTRPNFSKNNHDYQNDTSTIYNYIIKTIEKKDKKNIKIVKSNKIKENDMKSKIDMLLTQKDKKSLPNSSKIPKSLQDNLQNKDGIISNGINGRRVNHSTRAVVGGYAFGKFGYLGISSKIAEQITKRINLKTIGSCDTISNKEMLLKKILSYKNVKLYNSVTNETYRLTPTIAKNKIENINDISYWYIDVPIKNNDIVIYNRQPSLRSESISAHIVKIVDDSYTIKLHLSCTPPTNTDFDGDECNIHILQDIQSDVEIIELASPIELLLSSQKGTPLFIPVQDTIIGLYLLSKDTNIKLEDAYNYSMLTNNIFFEKYNLYKKINKTNNINGNLIISLCFDYNFNYKLINPYYEIKNGIILNKSECLTKSILCGGIKSIIHNYYFQIGKKRTGLLYDSLIYIAHYYLQSNCMTIGFNDMKPEEIIDIPKNINPNIVLNYITTKTKNHKKTNLELLVDSGAKGNDINIMQIKHLLGQQSLDGLYIEPEMRTNRTLPYFEDNKSIKSKGFIENCFFNGLSLSETFFHCKAGRRGVSDSITKVADSGYNTKKLTKFMENLSIQYDYTVREIENNKIIQFLFGSDGMNPCRLPSTLINNEYKKVYFTKEDFNKIKIYEYKIAKQAIQKIKIGYIYDTNVIKSLKKKIINQLKYLNLKMTDNDTLSKKQIDCLGIMFLKRTMQPGTPIGFISATNVGETATQLLLQTFHFSGINSKNITGGTKRMNQLLNRTCKSLKEKIICFSLINEKIYKIRRFFYLYSKQNNLIYTDVFKILMQNRCEQIINEIKTKKLSDVVSQVCISNCINNCSVFNLCDCEKTKFKLIYTFILDIIHDLNDVIKYNNIFLKYDYIILNNYKLLIYSNLDKNDTCMLNKTLLSSCFYINEINYYVDQCEYHFNESKDDFELIFIGITLNKLINIPYINKNSIYSNDIFENEIYFGLEATRNFLYNEIIQVCSFDGADIDFRYINLIADAMSYQGKITSITNIDNSILTNALFEKPIKKIINYSLYDTIDKCKSVESSIILGTKVNMGTNSFKVIKS